MVRCAQFTLPGLLLLLACGRGPLAIPPVMPVPVPVEAVRPPAEAPFGRPGLRNVPVPPSQRAAIEAGTRTAHGEPGPAYWQQRVDYRIEAELNPATGRLDGRQTVTYHNRSPETLTFLVFHLYQNLFRAGEIRNEPVPVTGGITIEDVLVAGREAERVPFAGAPGPGPRFSDDGSTIMTVRLPAPLPPRDSVTIDVAWHYTVPPAGAPRTGQTDHTVYNVAQWYPQVAVFDDLRGWHTEPYMGRGEFYLEYGTFEVSLTVPEGWLVGATGTLQNAEDVLSENARERLRLAMSVDTVVHVVAAAERGPGSATQRAPGGQLTWEFRADSVRDFAFATSDQYLWDATRARTAPPGTDATYAAVHTLYLPQPLIWRRAAEFARHATEFHSSHWVPYAYPQITVAQGPVEGMEYPMLVFVTDFSDAHTLYSVINHEIAHQWYPMLVGSNETAYAWQDEGFATYVEHLATMDFFPDARPFIEELFNYATIAGTEAETPMMRPADLYPDYESFGVASYTKPALLLRALAAIIGPDTLHQALVEYTRAWSFRHPTPLDFFRTVERVAGRKLDWFWYPWWYETGVLDQSIVAVSAIAAPTGERVAITVGDVGDNPMPILLEVTTTAGRTYQLHVPVEVWFGGERQHTVVVDVDAPVARVAINPQTWFPDINRRNNIWER